MSMDPIRYAPDPVEDMKAPYEFFIEGWVYVLSNECMPGIYKVGMTTSDPEMRAKEVSQGTGVPMPYVVEKAYFSTNPREDEKNIHEELAEFRFNPSREFFRCSLEIIEEAFDGMRLHERCGSVSRMADDYSIISFEYLHKLDLETLYDDIGLRVFGNKLAIAERLIRLGAKTVLKLTKENMSLVFANNIATPVVQDIQKRYEAYLAHSAIEQSNTGIYGPKQPTGF